MRTKPFHKVYRARIIGIYESPKIKEFPTEIVARIEVGRHTFGLDLEPGHGLRHGQQVEIVLRAKKQKEAQDAD